MTSITDVPMDAFNTAVNYIPDIRVLFLSKSMIEFMKNHEEYGFWQQYNDYRRGKSINMDFYIYRHGLPKMLELVTMKVQQGFAISYEYRNYAMVKSILDSGADVDTRMLHACACDLKLAELMLNWSRCDMKLLCELAARSEDKEICLLVAKKMPDVNELAKYIVKYGCVYCLHALGCAYKLNWGEVETKAVMLMKTNILKYLNLLRKYTPEQLGVIIFYHDCCDFTATRELIDMGADILIEDGWCFVNAIGRSDRSTVLIEKYIVEYKAGRADAIHSNVLNLLFGYDYYDFAGIFALIEMFAAAGITVPAPASVLAEACAVNHDVLKILLATTDINIVWDEITEYSARGVITGALAHGADPHYNGCVLKSHNWDLADDIIAMLKSPSCEYCLSLN